MSQYQSHNLQSQDGDHRIVRGDVIDIDASPRPPRRLRVQVPQITASSSFFHSCDVEHTSGRCIAPFCADVPALSGLTKAQQLLSPPTFPPASDDEEEGWEILDVAAWPGLDSCSSDTSLYACSSILYFHSCLDTAACMLCQT